MDNDRINIIGAAPFWAALLALALFAQGCAHRQLEAGGVYDGDRLLYEFDGVLLAYGETTQELLDLAARHPQTVADIDGLPDFLAQLKQDRARVINEAGAIRNDYENGKALAGDLAGQQRVLNIAINMAREYVLRVASTPQALLWEPDANETDFAPGHSVEIVPYYTRHSHNVQGWEIPDYSYAGQLSRVPWNLKEY